ncbi:MAG: nucleotidyltransferase family protein [Planctomycetes bacterium]|nr:nucleotidyltransferase family protein [Planctomycetota bacterium]
MDVPTDVLGDLCRRWKITRLEIFGSAVRDDFGPKSDIDLLVLFAPDVEMGFLAWARCERELSKLFRRRVDLVPRDCLKPLIRDSVLASAKVLYAA